MNLIKLSSAGRRREPADQGSSLIEVVVATAVIGVAVAILGAGSALLLTGLRAPTLRFEAVIVAREDLARWPASPIEICGPEGPVAWGSHLVAEQVQSWGAPHIWVDDLGWQEVSGVDCEGIPVGEVSAMRLSGGLVDTVVLVKRP